MVGLLPHGECRRSHSPPRRAPVLKVPVVLEWSRDLCLVGERGRYIRPHTNKHTDHSQPPLYTDNKIFEKIS